MERYSGYVGIQKRDTRAPDFLDCNQSFEIAVLLSIALFLYINIRA